MSVESQIREASSRNAELLSILAETDHAHPDLEQQRRYISDLNKELQTANKRIADLDKRRNRDLKDHVKYRDSVMRRFAYKVSGKREKFEEKAANEEKDYFEGLQQSHEASDTKREVESMLVEANQTREKLEAELGRHRTAQADLDNLYDAIFQGPSPDYPEEDRREYESDAALKSYHDARVKVEGEEQAVKLLSQAQYHMRAALRAMQSALAHSTWDMWGGGTMADMMERSELSSADRSLNHARLCVSQAQKASPQVGQLPPVNVAAGSLMSDVFFDNIFTDMAFHDKIKQSDREMQNCARGCDGLLVQAQGRLRDGNLELKQNEQRLHDARVGLQKTREAVFQQVLSGAK